jgi:hypothetical protein
MREQEDNSAADGESVNDWDHLPAPWNDPWLDIGGEG